MSKKQDLATYKYGQPLFAAAWPRGKYIFVCGGGGSANSGIQSRVVAACFEDGKLSDEIGSVTLKSTCDRLCFAPNAKLLLVLSGGAVIPYDVHFNGKLCQFVVPQGEVVQAFERLADVDVKSMAFSGDGALLAFGSVQGVLHIWQRDGFAECLVQQIKVDGKPVLKELTNVDFSPAAPAEQPSTSRIVAATCEDGNCYVCTFSLPARTAAALPGIKPPEAAVSVLAKPADMKNGMLKHCRFLSNGRLATSMVHRGRSCVLLWRLVTGGGFDVTARSKNFNPITGMDVSPDGLHIGIATAEGEAFLLDAKTLNVKKSVRKAHMVFATSVAFAGDSHAFVSTSADASARIVTLPSSSFSTAYMFLLALFIVLLLVIAVAVILTP